MQQRTYPQFYSYHVLTTCYTIPMSEKHSAAKKKFWASIPKPQRTAHMTKIAHSRWATVSPEERRIIALRMVKARRSKKQD